MPKHYNYIITGAGCAGSSLLLRIMREPFFKDKTILIIDQSGKNTNDRTWCFWEKEAGIFEPVVHHQWKELQFFSDRYSAALNIAPYQYKMIRGIDLYTFVKNESAAHANIEWRYEKVKAIDGDDKKATIQLASENITADYIFNSILFEQPEVPQGKYFLLQHFKGWMIETDEPCFDSGSATFMDFRADQKSDTAFFYVLPTSATTALVEYTLFSEKILAEDTYDTALRDYISSALNIKKYRVTHEESGVIPMTNISFPLQEGRITYIGIAGGQAKGSSGYAFQFIQKRTQAIVQSLIKNNHPITKKRIADKKFHLYDSVLLNILYNHTMSGAEIFTHIFQKNPPALILKFLDNETTLREDLKIMRSVPVTIFLPAAFRELFR